MERAFEVMDKKLDGVIKPLIIFLDAMRLALRGRACGVLEVGGVRSLR